MACGHSEGGRSGRFAGRHDLGGVVRTVDLVGHGEAGDRAAATDTAVERAAGDAATFVRIDIHGIRALSASGAADDLHVAADVELSAVTNAAAITFVACRMAVLDLRRAGQGGDAITIIADTATPSSPIRSLRCRRAVGDAATAHVERAPANAHPAAMSHIPPLCYRRAADDIAAGHIELAAENEHAAAPGVKARVRSRAADDAAAGHGERAAANVYTAALVGAAAGDDAAGDGVGACAAIRQQRPRVGGIIFAEILEGLCCRVVLQRQAASALDLKDAAAAGHLQDVVVEVEGGVTRDGQGAGDGHVSIQLVHATAQAAGDTSQLCHVGVLRQRLGRQQRQRHDQRHQDRYKPSFHFHSSVSVSLKSNVISSRENSWAITSPAVAVTFRPAM